VTEYKRTRQTAEPTAERAGIEAVMIPAQDIATLVAKLKETKDAALVVGHSNTVPEILKALGASESITIGESDYDNLFIVAAATPPKVIRLHLPAAEQKPVTGKAASASAGD
jgi:phosphohistidine phosphatase SixA